MYVLYWVLLLYHVIKTLYASLNYYFRFTILSPTLYVFVCVDFCVVF